MLSLECVRLYCRVSEQKNKQNSSHASIPVWGSLKLCVSSARNYWLCKSDRMNKSEAKCFWPTLLASTAIISTLSNKVTTAHRAFNIWTASPPSVPHKLSVFVRLHAGKAEWAWMFFFPAAPCCFKPSCRGDANGFYYMKAERQGNSLERNTSLQFILTSEDKLFVIQEEPE